MSYSVRSVKGGSRCILEVELEMHHATQLRRPGTQPGRLTVRVQRHSVNLEHPHSTAVAAAAAADDDDAGTCKFSET